MLIDVGGKSAQFAAAALKQWLEQARAAFPEDIPDDYQGFDENDFPLIEHVQQLLEKAGKF